MSFVHLHLHTEYSLLDGMCRIDDVFVKAKALGMTAVAITDHGALYGAFKFFIKGKEYGVKPIIGVEAYKAKNSRHDKQPGIDKDQHHLVLLAKNLKGYKNLLKMITEAHLEGFYYKPRVDWELLEKYKEGIIVLSGCLSGEISQAILNNQLNEAERLAKKYEEIFAKDFYLELQRHPQDETFDKVSKELVKLSKKLGIPLVATNDVHYIDADDAYAQEILLCIQTQRTILETNRPLSMLNIPDFYFKSESEMRGLFLDLPEAIENTGKIANECTVEIPYGKLILPNYEIPEGETESKLLRKLVYRNKAKIKHFPEDVVDKRIEYELSIIEQKGYTAYFLIVQDFVNWAKDNGIAVGPGRGSAAGSLVSYLLNITGINPLEFSIPFERFLNPERPSPPDIDLDFADIRRDEVLQYMKQKFGEDKVGQIITFGTMEARLAIRDVARALGFSYAFGDRLAKMIPPPKQGFHMGLAKAIEESSALKFTYQTESDAKKVIEVALKLEGMPRHASVHAAGVVISDKPLTEYVPLLRESKEGRIITQYDMYSLDLNVDERSIGLMKMDVLGLRNLTILEEAISYVFQTRGKKVNIYEVLIDDKKTYELISRGETIGVFQIESPGMRRLAKDLQPTKISDIVAMVALYRPGPMDLIPTFIESKNNSKKVKYLHKDLKPILEETYGVPVYQEQVMEIAHQMAGYTMGEADNLRRAMGKKKKSLMKLEKEKFVKGCEAKGYPKKIADNIFNFIEKFAAYGFNKPHSASYALIAYWTAYMKANYPIEFMTALLTAELHGVAGPQREIKMAQAIEECRRMEIKVLPPDINKSELNFKIEAGAIRFGLSAIKNVGAAAIQSIIEARNKGKFTSFRDFLYKVELRKVNKKTVESLVKAGAFYDFANRATLLSNYPVIVREVNDLKTESQKGQYGLFSDKDFTKNLEDNFHQIEELDEEQLFNMEKEVIGFLITKNPLAKFEAIIKSKASKFIGEIDLQDANKTLVLIGIISGKKVIKTRKNNEDMAFLSIFDQTGSIEVVAFPRTYKEVRDLLAINQVVIFKGRVVDREDRLSVILDRAMKLS